MGGCWAGVAQMCSLMPAADSPAIAKYRARMEGSDSGSVHLKPAPAGSLLMLGYVALQVPDEAAARTFYMQGLGFRRSPREETGREVRANGGCSQMRLSCLSETGQPHSRAQRWPGSISIWVKDCRESMEALRRFGGAGPAGLILEVAVPTTAGMYKLVVRDTFRANVFHVEEAPRALVERFSGLAADPFSSHDAQSCSICLCDFEPGDERRTLPCNHAFHADCIKAWFQEALECPMCKAEVKAEDALESNVLGIVDATYRTSARGAAAALARFYRWHLACAAEDLPGSEAGHRQCVVHLSPTDGLHQTLRFEEDPDAPACENPGAICVYAASAAGFRTAFTRCEKDGLVQRPGSWRGAEAALEFHVSGCVDPDTSRQVLPLRHIVRSPLHPECPARPEGARERPAG